MSTNKVVLREVDEFMADYQPIYQAIFPLFLSRAKKYSEVVGKVTNRRLEVVGDVRSKHITPKDTEIKQISSTDSKKVFKKYFLGSQYTESVLQDHDGIEDVVAQVLDEHNKQADDLLFLGDGSAANNVENNGLFWSADSNYTLENSTEIDNANGYLPSLHSKIMATVNEANKLPGRKVLMIYGSLIPVYLTSIYSTSAPVVFRKVLEDAMGPNWEIIIVPEDINLGNVNGWIAVNMDQIMLHYTTVPVLKNQGVNDEEGHTWHNFLMGSMMVEVRAKNGIIRQPVTFEAP